MADNTAVHIGENSPEHVAYKLMRDIAHAEKVVLAGAGINSNREWILRTYMQCLMAVKTPQYPGDIVGMHRA